MEESELSPRMREKLEKDLKQDMADYVEGRRPLRTAMEESEAEPIAEKEKMSGTDVEDAVEARASLENELHLLNEARNYIGNYLKEGIIYSDMQVIDAATFLDEEIGDMEQNNLKKSNRGFAKGQLQEAKEYLWAFTEKQIVPLEVTFKKAVGTLTKKIANLEAKLREQRKLII